MSEAAAPPAPSRPREQRWRYVLIALLAFVLVPAIPYLRAVVPIEQTLWLLVPAIAVCALVGWWAGGRFAAALAWGALAALVVARAVPLGIGQYAALANGWSLLAAGAFGVVCLLASGSSFLPRALWALGLALVLASALALLGWFSPSRAEHVLVEQFAARNGATLAQLDSLVRDPSTGLSRVVGSSPLAASAMESFERNLGRFSRAAVEVFPALLALESLAALALAWALWQRLSRARIGAPLGRLREFRFNDQLVWGVIVGAVVLLVPTLAPLRGAGLNLLVFFGALYAVRGLGVIVWFLSSAGAFVITAMIVSAVLLSPAATAIALGLGIGDTWIDWRGRASSSTGTTL